MDTNSASEVPRKPHHCVREGSSLHIVQMAFSMFLI